MKSTFLFFATLLILGIVILPACKKSSGPATSGNFAGGLLDSISDTLGIPTLVPIGIKDTMVITANGNLLTFTDKNTGSVFTGTLGAKGTNGDVTYTLIDTISNAMIKQGASLIPYSGSGGFDLTTDAGTKTNSVMIILYDASNTVFYFEGVKY